MGRRVCSTVSASQDNILEDTEEVEFGLIRTGTSTDFIVLQPNSTKLLIFDRDGKWLIISACFIVPLYEQNYTQVNY